MAGGSEQEFGTGQTNEAVREDRTDLSGEVHQIEELDEEKVFRVILPADTSHIFDFIMDPQQLMTEAGLRKELLYFSSAMTVNPKMSIVAAVMRSVSLMWGQRQLRSASAPGWIRTL